LDIAMAVATRDGQTLVTEVAHDLGQRFQLQQGAEDESKAIPHFLVRMFFHDAVVATHQPRWQGKRQFAALGFAEDASDQAATQGVHLQFGDRAFVACQIKHKLYFLRAFLSESANIAAK
jgi:hypothetical protein